MDKYGVVLSEEHEKVAVKAGRPCPGCGSRSVDYGGLTPHCSNCGTQPWERKADAESKDFRR